jgi:integrase
MYSHARCVREYMENVELINSIPAANDMKQAMLADQLSPQTINRRLAVVRRVLNLAYNSWEWLREPLGKRVEMLSEKGLQREVFLTAAEVTSFLQTMQNDEAKRFILLESWTGMRKSEIRRLEPKSWRAPIIMLSTKTKSGKSRPIPLVQDMHWIMDYLPFTISDWDLRKDFERAREILKMQHVRMHDLRHTFASWLVENPDIPLTVVRDLLGHSSLTVTSKYSHLRTEVLEDAILSLSGHKKGHTAKRKAIRKRAQVID